MCRRCTTAAPGLPSVPAVAAPAPPAALPADAPPGGASAMSSPGAPQYLRHPLALARAVEGHPNAMAAMYRDDATHPLPSSGGIGWPGRRPSSDA
mmetsp:Transcript_23294/g.37779  ORF Transcript_23294/g.37779 Transcript_23294/m.37779 type:complete len:95 (-) Transcript_23294:278-562(-)